MNHEIESAFGSNVSPTFGSSDFQTCKNNGATVITFNGMSDATFLLSAIAGPARFRDFVNFHSYLRGEK